MHLYRFTLNYAVNPLLERKTHVKYPRITSIYPKLRLFTPIRVSDVTDQRCLVTASETHWPGEWTHEVHDHRVRAECELAAQNATLFQ